MSKREPVVRDTKQRILAAAMEVFGQRGYGGATVEDVAASAGLTKGAVYYYFVDKDALGLVQGLLQAGMDRGDVARFDPCALGRVLSGALLEATHHILNQGDAEAAMAVVAQIVHSFALPRTVAS